MDAQSTFDPNDLDAIERSIDHSAAEIGPHEGKLLHKMAKRVPGSSHIQQTGPCHATAAWLAHGNAARNRTRSDHPALIIIGGCKTYDQARDALDAHWPGAAEGTVFIFLHAHEHGMRALIEERVFHSSAVAGVGYLGRLVYARKATTVTIDERKRTQRVRRLWHAHLQLVRVPMPRPVRVAGREVMKRMQGGNDEP